MVQEVILKLQAVDVRFTGEGVLPSYFYSTLAFYFPRATLQWVKNYFHFDVEHARILLMRVMEHHAGLAEHFLQTHPEVMKLLCDPYAREVEVFCPGILGMSPSQRQMLVRAQLAKLDNAYFRSLDVFYPQNAQTILDWFPKFCSLIRVAGQAFVFEAFPGKRELLASNFHILNYQVSGFDKLAGVLLLSLPEELPQVLEEYRQDFHAYHQANSLLPLLQGTMKFPFSVDIRLFYPILGEREIYEAIQQEIETKPQECITQNYLGACVDDECRLEVMEHLQALQCQFPQPLISLSVRFTTPQARAAFFISHQEALLATPRAEFLGYLPLYLEGENDKDYLRSAIDQYFSEHQECSLVEITTVLFCLETLKKKKISQDFYQSVTELFEVFNAELEGYPHPQVFLDARSSSPYYPMPYYTLEAFQFFLEHQLLDEAVLVRIFQEQPERIRLECTPREWVISHEHRVSIILAAPYRSSELLSIDCLDFLQEQMHMILESLPAGSGTDAWEMLAPWRGIFEVLDSLGQPESLISWQLLRKQYIEKSLVALELHLQELIQSLDPRGTALSYLMERLQFLEKLCEWCCQFGWIPSVFHTHLPNCLKLSLQSLVTTCNALPVEYLDLEMTEAFVVRTTFLNQPVLKEHSTDLFSLFEARDQDDIRALHEQLANFHWRLIAEQASALDRVERPLFRPSIFRSDFLLEQAARGPVCLTPCAF